MRIEYYTLKEVSLDRMKYAVVMARYSGRWIFVQHRERKTWEIPGGHVEENESVFDCAARELMEETGSIKFALFPVTIFTVVEDAAKEWDYGMLFFADVHEMGPLPGESEIARQELCLDLPRDLTYPEVQSELYVHTLKFIMERGL